MPRERPTPLLTFNETQHSFTPTYDDDKPRRRWYHNVPLYGIVFLILAPQPSILLVLINHYLRALRAPITFTIHLLVIYTITFLLFSSLIVLVARDPGPVSCDEPNNDADVGEEVGLTEALMSPDDFLAPGKWCRSCWAPKPDRTHHCSFCGRCVLKMDHHCPWLGNRCVGHRTYPAFIHFLFCITLLSIYTAVLCAHALYYAFNNPYSIDESTPIHEILLTFAGVTFALVIGSFFIYHVYLVSTNQTTLEHITPFLLLRYVPVLPATESSRTSEPPHEHELSYAQRRLVKSAHGRIRIYDIGIRKNWSQVFGWKRHGLIYRILCGGGSMGDGKLFPRNADAEQLLARLARDLAGDKDT
ncbi:DHHC palmitoyltransferase-domain-containing protein [Rhodocollybia butyracea]|uniref:Palmitoyltransferase n=1 Tax=Rhodocollybia butyracea TaxID=206335 RepID=A0A9P5PG40_9AGAR|nr:DHHC palmitoyltransferase-domain-containing protein [Rhodocollybia butyracea]